MKPITLPILALTFVLFPDVSGRLQADSITKFGSAGGVDRVVERAIVEAFDQRSIIYWTIEPDGHLVRNRENWSDGWPIPKVARSSSAEKQEIITEWKKKGSSVRLTNEEGSVVEVSNLFVGFRAPSGYQYTQYASPPRCACIYVSDNGKSETKIPFPDIKRIRFEEERLLVTLKSGRELSGTFRHTTGSGLLYGPVFEAVEWDQDGHPSEYGATQYQFGDGAHPSEHGAWAGHILIANTRLRLIKLMEFGPF